MKKWMVILLFLGCVRVLSSESLIIRIATPQQTKSYYVFTFLMDDKMLKHITASDLNIEAEDLVLHNCNLLVWEKGYKKIEDMFVESITIKNDDMMGAGLYQLNRDFFSKDWKEIKTRLEKYLKERKKKDVP